MDLHINEVQKQRKQARLSAIAENAQHFRVKMDDYEKRARFSSQLLTGMEQDLAQMITLAQAALQNIEQVK